MWIRNPVGNLFINDENNIEMGDIDMKVFMVRADFGKYTDAFLANEYVGIGWFESKKYSINELNNRDNIIKLYREFYPESADGTVFQNSGQIFRFINEINNGDIVITPYNDLRLLIGKVQSEAFFKKDETSSFYYRRKVEWFKKFINRQNYSIPLQNTLRSSLTVFNVSQVHEVLDSVGIFMPEEIKKEKKVESDGIYESIKEKFLELDAEEFEQLVSYVLQSLGFEATQEVGKVGDGGIDFEGELNVMGIASINLQVQVKRYTDAVIREKEIRNFRGALKRDYQGCFITLSRFNKKAVESATDPEKVLIKLINGRQFIDIFIEQYEKITDAIYSDDNDVLADKLKFKKALLPE